jgi:nuclear GTP-binding protein
LLFKLVSIKNKNVKIPELKHFKKNILDDIEKKKINSARNQLIENLKNKMELNSTVDYKNLNEMQNDAKSKLSLYNREEDSNIINDDELKLNVVNKDFSRRAYVKDLKQVIESSDVILQVLDARDPESCRSKELESQILAHKDDKKIILVLNKIDLVPT